MCIQYAYASDLKMGKAKKQTQNIVTFIPIDPVSHHVCQINAPADTHLLTRTC